MVHYPVIFFDLDHTLIDTMGQYDAGLAEALARLYKDTNVPKEWREHFLHHNNSLWPEYDKRLITMETLRRERFLRTWKDFGVIKSTADADEFHEVYDETFETTLFPYAGTWELLKAVAQHHRLGIITNGSPDLQWRKMGITGLQKFFDEDKVIISERIGAAKPHPSVYAAACKAFGVSPSDALMIGDNYEHDVAGARRCGIEAIWYVPDKTMTRVLDADGEQIRAVTNPTDLLSRIAELEHAMA